MGIRKVPMDTTPSSKFKDRSLHVGWALARRWDSARSQPEAADDMDHLTFLGSALFTRRVSGPRVVLCTPRPGSPEPTDAPAPSETVKVKGKYCKVIDGHAFECYGAHTDFYPCCYLTAACAIGASRKEMESFVERLEFAVQDYKNGAGRKEKEKKPVLGS
ncbi:unnamed protein product [Effrenium voratum]|uniref:Selenocysteine synthase n=1 Tax=Effrenium voratum TaxID=2562239 RepID=A0AA36J125_9DINO|nr:unnamed protein product [Effrenium voratum]CAJ1397652.1 unnamed protein product [Effrenium voratum]CAJ1429813.1 unnamed protein product [Effrenium voratum]